MNPEQHAAFYREILADIAVAEAQLAELRAVARYHQEKAEINDPIGDIPEIREAQLNPVMLAARRVAPSGRYSRMKQIVAAEAVLLDAGGPLSTLEIARRMIAGGFPKKDIGKLKTSLFTGMTRRPDTFVKTSPGTWNVKAKREGFFSAEQLGLTAGRATASTEEGK